MRTSEFIRIEVVRREDVPVCTSVTAEQILDTARDGGLSSANAKLLSENRLTFHGRPARDIRAVARENASYDNRLVVVGNRTYTLMVIYASGKHDGASVGKFFNSLEFR